MVENSVLLRVDATPPQTADSLVPAAEFDPLINTVVALICMSPIHALKMKLLFFNIILDV